MFSAGDFSLSPWEWQLLLLSTVLSSAFIIAANLFVILATATHLPLKTESNLYIASLAFTDLLTGATVMPITGGYLLTGEWTLGSEMCQVWLFLLLPNDGI